ncbi:MAG: GH36-type glycosyl hydrolase domain-containing protein [Bacteroidota bacterium]
MNTWHFLNDQADFALDDPHLVHYLYFPLANEAGLMSSVTPLLGGDIKTGQHSFLLPPVSAEDLHNSRSTRNFWLYIEGRGPWSAAGVSASQQAGVFSGAESTRLTAGFLWQTVSRINEELGVAAEATNFAPVDGAVAAELMRVRITNLRPGPLRFTPTAAVPIYGRSADNLRDHRHVTSLLHRIRVTPYGVAVRPTFRFDERGHRVNETFYGVLGAEGGGERPLGAFPLVEEFIGGGTLDWPETIVRNRMDPVRAGGACAGYEAIGALRFADRVLAPGESAAYIILMVVDPRGADLDALAAAYCSEAAFERHLRRNKEYWGKKLDRLAFRTGDQDFDRWTRWVALQPVLRRIYGCSFLPHHDYGRGGRGWRDLWQDCLALLLMDPGGVRDLLLANYAGVRIDGSNATIIGARPGEFVADRNNIPRVWMDHGAWPFLTTRLYIDQSGDLGFLLEEQTYFHDGQSFRARVLAPRPEGGDILRRADGEPYRGTVLEHILIQLVTQFFNVGDHNHIRLEGADWNDALDMAAEKGESVAFTALYGHNLMELSGMLLDLRRVLGADEVELAAEFLPLCDRLGDPVDYDDAAAKRALLESYFRAVRDRVAGTRVKVGLADLAGDLRAKAAWIAGHLQAREWLRDSAGHQWFNGYYDNDGRRVEGEFDGSVRMTLTGQVFPIMAGIATDEQTAAIVAAVDRHLRDPALGGYRLNTDFGGVQPALGRAFAFAYGHKENGAVFSHMAVMYAYALYRRGFVAAGHAVLASLYRLSADFGTSRIYPGIPEYFDPRGRGMYHYLTGSASWYLLTMLTEVYGVKGCLGDLLLEPKLLREQFDASGNAEVRTVFAGRELAVVYRNPHGLDHGQYAIERVRIEGIDATCTMDERAATIPRAELEKLTPGHHLVEVHLASRD